MPTQGSQGSYNSSRQKSSYKDNVQKDDPETNHNTIGVRAVKFGIFLSYFY